MDDVLYNWRDNVAEFYNEYFSEEELLDIFSEPPRIDRYVLDKYKHMAESRFLKRKDHLDSALTISL